MGKKRNLKSWLVMAVIFLLFGFATASADVIYVDADASTGGNGQSWGTAYKYLQDALYKPPTSGDQIWVAEGTYRPDENISNPGGTGVRGATFQLVNGVAIYGGFAGYAAADPNARDVELYETILSGDLNGDDIGFTNNGENSYHVVTGSGTDETAILDGFTITAGNANGVGASNRGGGMYNYPGSPTVTNCTFSGNTAMGTYGTGGGMYNRDGSPTVTNCTFSGNSAPGGEGCGGAMRNDWDSSPALTNCTFSGNLAPWGGGMWNYNSTPTVTNCTFSGNSAYRGGAILSGASNATLTNCTFSGNTASDKGGGIYNYVIGGPTLRNCILWGDMPQEIYVSAGSVVVTYSDVEGGYSGTGNINADPLFADADLRLSPGSPCIDAGDNTAVPGGVTTDLDGNPRFVDDPDTVDTGTGTPPIVDMGAYEYGLSIIYVDVDATGANDGSSWEDAYKYLQDALDVAGAGDYILVAAGTYRPDENTANPGGTGDRTATFQLINGVALYGGFAGFRAPDPNERDWQTNETILSGDLNGNDVPVNDPCDLVNEATRGENSYHVLTGSGTDATAGLDGFTITAGNANGTDTNSEGAGMRNYLGGPTVANCTFSENSAADAGGGMDNDSGDAIVVNCTFSRNSAMYDGGGMCNDNYDFQDGSPTVTNCTFNENWARWGGGMSNYDDSKTVVSNCIFRNNSAKERGGGMDNDVSTPTITNCTFSGNSAGSDGGGMNNENSSPVVSNCAFIGNSTEDGGGMCNYSSSPMVTNCTFTGNSAISPDVYVLGGGGMCNVEYSSPTLTNCILWGNSSPEPNGPQIALKDNSTVSISYCDLQGGQTAIYKIGTNNSVIWGEGNIDEAPLFIGPNGPDGIGGTADDEEDNMHLSPNGSPCFNTGDPGGDYSGQVDIDRQPRVAYGRVDMGADEVFPAAGDFEPDGDVDFADFAIFANHWLLGVE